MEPITQQQLLTQLTALARQAGMGTTAGTEAEPPMGEFSALLKQSIKAVNARQKRAAELANAFEMEDPKVDLAQVMVEKQKARVAFEALLQIRNQLVNSYQEIMRMPL
ncbi:MAG TPA: flagellar hook-basal body complex protein FliE [Gammaproteobacteria bacterium]|nr:flagellar hook-basal body complex protein FliE [Gammaproteobacteria bacterium]